MLDLTGDPHGEPATGARRIRFDEPFDTRRALARASQQARERGLYDVLIVDADAHHYETESWSEIAEYLEDPVLRHMSTHGGVGRLSAQSSPIPRQIGNQDLSGRVPRYGRRGSEQTAPSPHRDVQIVRRAMGAMAIDYQVVFPTPMLNLGMHPVPEVEAGVARAYARWLVERILCADERIRTMLYLPFNDPESSEAIVRDFGEAPGVVGFMVTSVRYRPVHDKAYMRLYAALEERGLPLGFHAAYNWQERSMEQLNRFISVHALGFPYYNMLHATNWVINGLPERFPDLKVLWIEGGLAWVPFLMQRLDDEYMMRSSEAPLLQRLPSEYMRDMYFTSQPMEHVNNARALQVTFEMIDAPNRLLFASDYPHWDFDLPSKIWDLPWLDGEAKRDILGRNAAALFELEDPRPA